MIFFNEYSDRISKDAVLPSLKGKDSLPSRTRPASKPIDLTLILQHIRLSEIRSGQSEFRNISYIIYAILEFSAMQTYDISEVTVHNMISRVSLLIFNDSMMTLKILKILGFYSSRYLVGIEGYCDTCATLGRFLSR